MLPAQIHQIAKLAVATHKYSCSSSTARMMMCICFRMQLRTRACSGLGLLRSRGCTRLKILLGHLLLLQLVSEFIHTLQHLDPASRS